MQSLQEIYAFNTQRLKSLAIPYREWEHESILDFETDQKVAARLGWTGVHTKSIFMKFKGHGYALYLTDKDSRMDSKKIKTLIGKRPSICTGEEMTAQLGCLPGAVCPVGLPEHVAIIIDSSLYACEELLYTPGIPEITFGVAGKHLKQLLGSESNSIYEL